MAVPMLVVGAVVAQTGFIDSVTGRFDGAAGTSLAGSTFSDGNQLNNSADAAALPAATDTATAESEPTATPTPTGTASAEKQYVHPERHSRTKKRGHKPNKHRWSTATPTEDTTAEPSESTPEVPVETPTTEEPTQTPTDAPTTEPQAPAPSETTTSAAPAPSTTSAAPAPSTTSAAPAPSTTSAAPKPSTTSAAPKPSTTSAAPKPTATTSAAVKPSTSSLLSSYAAEVLRLTNVERQAAGCPALTANSKLNAAALGHSQDMATNNYFAHASLDGRSAFQRMTDAGYKFSSAAENIAAGQTTAATVVQTWMNSAGHRANILNCTYTDMGIGMGTGGTYRYYWTQNFGRP